MEEDKNLKIQLDHIYGDSGTTRYSGYFDTDENVLWRDDTRADTVDKMRKTDGAVAALLRSIKAPILSTEWEVFSYDDSPLGEQIRLDIEQQVFKGDWFSFLRESLCFLEFGFYVFEKVWKIENGKVVLDYLAPRIPHSIDRWQIQGKNGQWARGIVQYIETDEFSGLASIEIPEKKLLILTNDKEGDNYAGESILRACYPHWRYKEMLYRISAIAADRFGVGTPAVYLPQDYGADDKNAANEMGENMRSSDKGYITLPFGYDAKILTPGNGGILGNIESMIEHHNRMILTSVLTQFLGLGGENSGSYALSEDQSSFFLRFVEDKARYFATAYNQQVIKDIVDYNYGEQEWYPELRFSPIGTKSIENLANTYKALVDSGLLEVDADVKKWIRTAFNLPEMTDADVEEAEDEDDGIVKPEEPTEPEELVEHHLAEYKQPYRNLTLEEQKIDFKELNEEMNQEEDGLSKELLASAILATGKYTEAILKKLKKQEINKIKDITFGSKKEIKDIYATYINKAYEYGLDMTNKELEVSHTKTKVVDDVLKADAELYAQAFISEIENTTKPIINDAYISGSTPESIAQSVKAEAEKKANKLVVGSVALISGHYINTARNQVLKNNAIEKGITGYQRSEILDSRTCNICRSLDQRIVKVDDPFAQMTTMHSSCRGIWVPIYSPIDNKESGIPKTIMNNIDTVDGKPVLNSFKQLKKPIL